MEVGIVGLAILLFIIFYLWSRRSGGIARGKEESLRQQIRRMLRQPPEEADETIDRYVASLKERFPGRSEEWYLEKVIYDLERDK